MFLENLLENLLQRFFPSPEPPELPSEVEAPESIRLGIWGPKASGKSTYIAMLYRVLQRSKEWEVIANQEAKKFASAAFEQMRQQGLFPKPTQVAETKIYEYKIIEKKGNDDKGKAGASSRKEIKSSKIFLEFLDIGGEFFENLEMLTFQKIIRKKDVPAITLIEYLRECHGIIFLLDPEKEGENRLLYEHLLCQLMEELQESFEEETEKTDNFRIPSYMAFCIAKADRLEIWEKHKFAQELGREMLGESMYEMLENQFCLPNRFKFFTISSVGYVPKSDGSYDSSPVVESSSKSQSASESTKSDPVPMSAVEANSNSQSPSSSTTSQSRPRTVIRSGSQTLETKTSEPQNSVNPSENIPKTSDSFIGRNHSQSQQNSGTTDEDESFTRKKPVALTETDNGRRIRTDVELNPFNVLSPIEWLIAEIKKAPPKLPSKPSPSPSVSEKTDRDDNSNSLRREFVNHQNTQTQSSPSNDAFDFSDDVPISSNNAFDFSDDD